MAKSPNPEVQIALITGSLKDRWELMSKFSKIDADKMFAEISQKGFDITDGSEIEKNRKSLKATGEELFSKALNCKKATDKSALLFFKYCWNKGETFSPSKIELFTHLKGFPKTHKYVCSLLADNMNHSAFFNYAELIKRNKLFFGQEELFLLKIKQSPFSSIVSVISKIDNLIAQEDRPEGLKRIQNQLEDRIIHVNNQELKDWFMKGQKLDNFYNRDPYNNSTSNIMFQVIKKELQKRKVISQTEDKTLSLKEITKLSR